MTPEELKALGVRTQDEVMGSAHARVLLLGPAKLGKTTSVLVSAPKPLHLNCDGQSASKEAKRQGAQFLELQCFTRAQLKKAVDAAKKLVKAGMAETIVLDSITILAEHVLQEMSVTLQGHDLWREYGKTIQGTVAELCKVDAHVFIIGHLGAQEDSETGVLPYVPGASKVKIPAELDDWVIFEYEAGRKPHERMYLLGPQKGWNVGCRNAKRTCAIEARADVLLREFGFNVT